MSAGGGHHLTTHQRLWEDPAVFRKRRERDAASREALVRVLGNRRPLAGGEDEFLELHGFVESLPTADRVAADPYAHLWTRLAFGLGASAVRSTAIPPCAEVLARQVGSEDPRRLLAGHLSDYKRLALGAALTAGVDVAFETPLEAELPMALPGARASLVGEGVARIFGVGAGRVRSEAAEARVEACPLACAAGFEVPLQPHGWRVPGLDTLPSSGRTSLGFQRSQVDLVARGLSVIARYLPGLFAQIRREIRWIAVNPMSEYDAMNYVSSSELGGAFAFRGVPNPYSAAEAMIHEFHHNRLFALEEDGSLFEDGALGHEDEALYYSPWRDEPRPLRGILHAIYVTTAQTRLWIEIVRRGDVDPALEAYARNELVRHPLILEIAIGQMDRHARLTKAGAIYFDEIRREVAGFTEIARELGVPFDSDAVGFDADGVIVPRPGADRSRNIRVRELVLDHVREFDRARQIAV